MNCSYKEIGTDRSAYDLGIPERARHVEPISRPKQRIEEAVRVAYADRSRRHREMDISFLYQPMGAKISLERLKQVRSYHRFMEALEETLKSLNLIQ